MLLKSAGALALTLALLLQPANAQTVAPDTLKLAREYVAKTDVDRDNTINAMTAPMTNMLQQQAGLPPDKAATLVREAMLPLLKEHYDALLDILATSYAAVLTADDLKAAIAFYDTPAGKHLITAQPRLAQSKMAGMGQWMNTLQPEMQARIQKVSKDHGW